MECAPFVELGLGSRDGCWIGPIRRTACGDPLRCIIKLGVSRRKPLRREVARIGTEQDRLREAPRGFNFSAVKASTFTF